MWAEPKFRTLLLDPPWPERGGGKIKRGADRHYDLISTKEEILQVIVREPLWRPDTDAHLYCWVTNNYLDWGLWLVGALGFVYKTNVVWEKVTSEGDPATGLGQYFRGAHELLLFATRGNGALVRTEDRSIGSVIRAPRGRHSQKPEESYRLIEARSKGPYFEMFARMCRPGWCAAGNELSSDTDSSPDENSDRRV